MGNEAKHSPEPWRHEVFNAQRPGLGWDVYGPDGARVASEMDSEADARRIVAAVNAVAGIPTAALEAGALARALDAAAGAHYCATCWDNPAHSLCEKHLDPLTAALHSLGRL